MPFVINFGGLWKQHRDVSEPVDSSVLRWVAAKGCAGQTGGEKVEFVSRWLCLFYSTFYIENLSLLERCCKCLGPGRNNVYNPKAVLNQGEFKNVNKGISSSLSNLPVPRFLLCCAPKQTPQTEALQWPVWCLLHQWRPQIHNWEWEACSLSQAFAASVSMRTPTALRLSCSGAPGVGSFACGLSAHAAALASRMHLAPLQNTGAVDITTICESFWINYVLLRN